MNNFQRILYENGIEKPEHMRSQAEKDAIRVRAEEFNGGNPLEFAILRDPDGNVVDDDGTHLVWVPGVGSDPDKIADYVRKKRLQNKSV